MEMGIEKVMSYFHLVTSVGKATIDFSLNVCGYFLASCENCIE